MAQTDEQLCDALRVACMASAKAMGPTLKTMSWFGRNVCRSAEAVR